MVGDVTRLNVGVPQNAVRWQGTTHCTELSHGNADDKNMMQKCLRCPRQLHKESPGTNITVQHTQIYIYIYIYTHTFIRVSTLPHSSGLPGRYVKGRRPLMPQYHINYSRQIGARTSVRQLSRSNRNVHIFRGPASFFFNIQ
jgi:hypothetical protein